METLIDAKNLYTMIENGASTRDLTSTELEALQFVDTGVLFCQTL